MPKKTEKQQVTDSKDFQYEKLREELFQYRVEISSYKKSMKYLIGCVSVVIAVLAFFGYDKIDTIIKGIERQTNQRLAKTDSLLSTIDIYYLDSLKAVVSEKTHSYEEAIAALERGTQANQELFRIMIENMSYNTRIENSFTSFNVADSQPSYIGKEGIGFFDIVYYTGELNDGGEGECYVVLEDGLERDDSDFFLVEVLPNGRNVAIFYQCFKIQGKYNKIPFVIHRFENYSDYRLRVIYIKQSEKNNIGYSLQRPVKIKLK